MCMFVLNKLFYRDDKVKGNISRIFKIWGERGIYDETFIADLNGLLDCAKGVSSDTAKLVAEFQVCITNIFSSTSVLKRSTFSL
jgi:hypothetical protein